MLVERVDSVTLAARVHPGDEIVAVDGVPVQRYAEERIAPFVSSSTPQDRRVRTFGYQLLSGDAAALPAILEAKALIIDVRANGGGSSNIGWDVLSYLSAAPIVPTPQYVRVDDPYA